MEISKWVPENPKCVPLIVGGEYEIAFDPLYYYQWREPHRWRIVSLDIDENGGVEAALELLDFQSHYRESADPIPYRMWGKLGCIASIRLIKE